MLTLEVSKIPAAGMAIDEELSSGPLHLEKNDGVQLSEGGRLACRVESGEERLVQVSGRLQASLRLVCGRCLETFTLDLDERLELAYLPQPAGGGDEEEVHLSDRDLVVAYYENDRIDLGEMVREQLILSLSMKRLCREDCRGLCPQCGANRNTTTCACPVPPADSRWEKLRSIIMDAGDAVSEGSRRS